LPPLDPLLDPPLDPLMDASGDGLSFPEFPQAHGPTAHIVMRTTAQSADRSFMPTSLSAWEEPGPHLAR
jgi:hypothetical protein